MNYTLDKLRQYESQYNSPLYIFRKQDFVENYKRFENCFKSIYSNYQLSYSYKTNYTPAICALVKELGGYAEVVSDMEYSVAKKIGYENEHIIYNGPYKGRLAQEHLLAGGILNIDNLEEVRKICLLADEYPQKNFEVGIRVNIHIGQSFVSRFGIDADSEDLSEAVNCLKNKKNLKLVGLHCHIGQSRTVEAWKNRAEIMLNLADKYFEQPPKYLDLGSGMFAVMEPELAIQFGDNIPSFEDYAKVVATSFAKHYENVPENERPTLFTEPGTTVINSYIDFVGKVDSIKTIKEKEFVVLNCSKDNIGDICKMKKLPIEIVSAGGKQEKCNNASFVGYTCLEHDVMYTEFEGELAVGDFVVFKNTGGYSNVSKPPFIAPNCAMIEVENNENSRLIKRPETFEDVFLTYIF